MNPILESHSVSEYLDKIQTLKVLSTNNPDKLEKLLEIVLDQKISSEHPMEWTHLMHGEHAFHNGNYEQALIHYMQARSIPNFEFFCYRATAYVSFLRGDNEKATSFILKALKMRSADYDTLKLYHEILIQSGDREKAAEIKTAIEKIECENIDSSFDFDTLGDASTSAPNDSPEHPAPSAHTSLISDHPINPKDTPPMNTTYSTFQETEDPFFQPAPGAQPLEESTTSPYIAAKLGIDIDTEKALEQKIQQHQQKQTWLVQQYLEESQRNRTSKNYCLNILSGWSSNTPLLHPPATSHKTPAEILLEEHTRQHSSGLFIRWNGKGIVLNPGPCFLQYFHACGYYIGDIHYVIVTHENPDAQKDIHKIYDLNYQLNKINPELHIIHYYLNHKAYQKLSTLLKPNFKQERNTVHSLELFLDSPDVEQEEIGEGITLNYFSTLTRSGYPASNSLQEAARTSDSSGMGIRLDLSSQASSSSGTTRKIGYVSGTLWSPLLSHHLGSCDILILGFGSTNPNDYDKLHYNENSLGYFGTSTLAEELNPKLLLCTEFEGHEGDIRMEAVRKLRKEYAPANNGSPSPTTILPADNGLNIDLITQQVECSVTQTLLRPEEVHVMRSSEPFGKLHYLAPDCILS